MCFRRAGAYLPRPNLKPLTVRASTPAPQPQAIAAMRLTGIGAAAVASSSSSISSWGHAETQMESGQTVVGIGRGPLRGPQAITPCPEPTD